MTNLLLLLLILSSLWLTAAGRISTGIRLVAAQCFGLSLLPLLLHAPNFSLRALLTVALMAGLKGYLLPRLFSQAQKQTSIHHESLRLWEISNPLLWGVASVGVAMWLGGFIIQLPGMDSPLFVPAGLATIFVGLSLMAARGRCLSQNLGYFVLGNGIFVFGVVFAWTEPILVELGIVLDVLISACLLKIALVLQPSDIENVIQS